MDKNKKNKTMNEVSKGYEDFIKAKEINPDGKKLKNGIFN